MSAAVIECMLLRWSDNQNGRTVTFLLPDDGGEHPFKGLKCGPANGDRLAVSVARIADDETQQPVTQEKEKKGWEELPLSQQAAMRCQEVAFIKFLQESYGQEYILEPIKNADEAAAFVRDICGGLQSRSELNTNPEAAAKWKDLDSEYLAWKLYAGG